MLGAGGRRVLGGAGVFGSANGGQCWRGASSSRSLALGFLASSQHSGAAEQFPAGLAPPPLTPASRAAPSAPSSYFSLLLALQGPATPPRPCAPST